MPIICRTCGEPIYNVNPRNLFKHENEDIRRNIEALTGIKLTSDSHMPSHICSCCYLDLEHSIAFRSRCLETHTQLMNAKHEKLSISQLFPAKLEQIDPLDGYNQNEEDSFSKSEDYSENTNAASLEEATEETPNCQSPQTRIISCRDPNKDCRKVTRRTSREVTNHSTIMLPEAASKSKHVAPAHETQTEITKPKRKKQSYAALEKNFVCDVCGWSFRDISNLKSHALRHSGEKKFDCKECDCKFFTQPLLMLHIRVHHRGEKPFVCKYCGMAFRNSPTRCRHERKFHANQLPYECDLCSRTFITQISLNSHKLIHVTGEKIQHCKTCNKTFKEAASLRKHNLTKFHLRRVNLSVKGERYRGGVQVKVVSDEDMDYEFSDSIIEEVDE